MASYERHLILFHKNCMYVCHMVFVHWLFIVVRIVSLWLRISIAHRVFVRCVDDALVYHINDAVKMVRPSHCVGHWIAGFKCEKTIAHNGKSCIHVIWCFVIIDHDVIHSRALLMYQNQNGILRSRVRCALGKLVGCICACCFALFNRTLYAARIIIKASVTRAFTNTWKAKYITTFPPLLTRCILTVFNGVLNTVLGKASICSAWKNKGLWCRA